MLGVTTTSGPGIALESETIGLAVMLEVPVLVVDVQCGGPSTGQPTNTEQPDLLRATFGRNGEAPVPVVAPQSPADCFDAAIEAIRIAVTHRTPVMLLSDGPVRRLARAFELIFGVDRDRRGRILGSLLRQPQITRRGLRWGVARSQHRGFAPEDPVGHRVCR